MSRWRGEPVCVGISADSLARVSAQLGAQHSSCITVPAPVQPLRAGSDAWLAPLRELMAEAPRAADVRLTIAPDLVRWWIVEPPTGTASMRELALFASMRFEELFSAEADNWSIDADWRASGPTVCGAIPRGLGQAMANLAGELRWRRWDASAATTRRRGQLHAVMDEPERWAWIDLQGGHATLWWFRGRLPVRVADVRVDERRPWAKVQQELLRGEAAAFGEESLQEAHWTNTENLPAPSEQMSWKWVRRPLRNRDALGPSGTGLAELVAGLGML